jgi:hypothetical protein
LQVEVEERPPDRHVRDEEGEDERAEQVDPGQAEAGKDQGEAEDGAGGDAEQPERGGDADGVPPAPPDELRAAAEGLADRLVSEEDFLLDEEPGDVFVDRDREADDRDRQQEEAEDRQQLGGDDAPEASQRPPPSTSPSRSR